MVEWYTEDHGEIIDTIGLIDESENDAKANRFIIGFTVDKDYIKENNWVRVEQ